ncbi:hypothetical protein JL37_11055 [Achromobacter sp. RTa]|nr:hypothetical protein JL37_11055 [Achromobacter sp. RTa]
MCRTTWPVKMMVLSLLISSLAGCAALVRVGVEYCDHARPIYFDSETQVDQTPAAIRREVLEGNETWRRLCSGR